LGGKTEQVAQLQSHLVHPHTCQDGHELSSTESSSCWK
jgi:hypothetical protein